LLLFSECKEAFSIFDRDNSGTITVKELEIALKSMGQHPTKDELEKMIIEVDVDGKDNI